MNSPKRIILGYPFAGMLLCVIHARCLYEYTSTVAKVGNFSSPNFPAKYNENLHCFYRFEGKVFETLKLSFFEFDLEPPFSKGCLTDYIDISSISVQNEKQLVGRYCGSQVPSSLLFMHPIAEIIFKSNHAVHHRGFRGMYEFKDEKFIPPPRSTPSQDDCGGVISGVGGVMTSPGYPTKFPKNYDCVWLIRVEHNQNIYLRVLQLQLYGSIANCGDAELSIMDGYSNINFNPKVLQKYCGDLKYYKNIDDQTQLSDRNRLLIRFKTSVTVEAKGDLENKIVGFKLVWTAVSFKDKGACQQYVCKESLYCINSASRSCTETRHYCIDKSLVCNSLPNCGMDDFSDEDKCNLPLVAGCGGAAGVLLLSTIFAIIIYRRHILVKKSLSQNQNLTMQLRQLEHSPSFATRQIGHFYSQPADVKPAHHVNCSIHSPYDVIMNNRYSYPTEV